MKRIGNLYQKICSVENLNLADSIARKGKAKQNGIQVHDLQREENIQLLHQSLLNKTFCTSPYTTFPVYEPKERTVFRLPYYPDRIVHHAVMNVLEPIFCSVFTTDTYSCIKGKGIHAASRGVKRALTYAAATTYCLKLDIKKFYPSVDHAILKQLLRRKIKDHDLLWLLDEIIDSADGLPIGNYLSQYFANYYLTFFDHWLKEVKRVRYYFRYADDLVILYPDKNYLHTLLSEISEYLKTRLNLTVKDNYQVFPVDARGIDFVGYSFYHSHTLLRKGIKQNFARMLARRPNKLSIASYYGWACHANCRHLLKTLLSNERIQRFPDHYLPKSLYRRQNKDRPDIKQGDRGTPVQNRTIPV
jgi:retron-type reverse transcriptase